MYISHFSNNSKSDDNRANSEIKYNRRKNVIYWKLLINNASGATTSHLERKLVQFIL